MTPSKIRIMLVDDHDVVRRGLGVFLRAFHDMELVGEASNGVEAVQMAEAFTPDVIMMDILMPKMDGIEATRRIKAQFPEIQIIALTSSKEDDMVRSALKAGAIAYLLKNTTFEDMEKAIRDAYHGKRTLSPEATEALIHTATRTATPEYHLTERELDVLRLMIRGLSNPEIAESLVISLSTVKFHISSILSKMNVSSRTEAVALAVEKRLVN